MFNNTFDIVEFIKSILPIVLSELKCIVSSGWKPAAEVGSLNQFVSLVYHLILLLLNIFVALCYPEPKTTHVGKH